MNKRKNLATYTSKKISRMKPIMFYNPAEESNTGLHEVAIRQENPDLDFTTQAMPKPKKRGSRKRLMPRKRDAARNSGARILVATWRGSTGGANHLQTAQI